jgi:hypothetical protein
MARSGHKGSGYRSEYVSRRSWVATLATQAARKGTVDGALQKKYPGRGAVLLADAHRPGPRTCRGPQMAVDELVHWTLSS